LENTVQGGSCNRTIEKEEYDVFLVQCVSKAIPPAKYTWQKHNGTDWVPIASNIVKVIHRLTVPGISTLVLFLHPMVG